MLEYGLRFLAGGTAVSAFAALGDSLRPKSFAGLFGAAPSIALATLFITLSQKGAPFVAMEGRSMIVGAFALAAYSWTVCVLLKKFLLSSWAATTAALVVWLAIATASGCYTSMEITSASLACAQRFTRSPTSYIRPAARDLPSDKFCYT
jgi:Protein of unknown function (DUF3147)